MTAVLVSAVLVLGTVVSTWQAIRATHAQGLAQERLVAETKALNEAETAQKGADKARENEATQRAQAEQERDRAVKAEQQADAARKDEAEQRGIAEANKKTAEANELLARRRFYAAQMNLAMQAFEAGDTPRVLQLLETQLPRFDEEDFRVFESSRVGCAHQNRRFRESPASRHSQSDAQASVPGRSICRSNAACSSVRTAASGP